MSQNKPTAFRLFKGATRPATVFGVPTTPFMLMICLVAIVGMVVSIYMWVLAPFLLVAMAQITKKDPRRFRIWWLWAQTKALNKNKGYWKASSYTPRHYEGKKKR
jgi:type IV secretion system protein VirB3